MIAIILAAGVGKRLRPITKDRPKTMVSLGGKTILEYICCNLASVGIKKIYAVVGHAKEKLLKHIQYIEEKLGLGFIVVENKMFDRSNTGYSLLLALEEVREDPNDIIIANGDIVFDFRILLKLTERNNTAIAVDNVKKLTKESFKVQIENGKLVKMGKEIDISLANGEYIGLAKLHRDDIGIFFSILKNSVKKDINTYYDYAFVKLSAYRKVDIAYTNGLKWTEVDYPEDLQYAKRIITEIYKGKKCM